jgi:protease IV
MVEHSSNVSGTHWERQTIQHVLLEHIHEQRRARRWSIFFKLVTIAFLVILLFAYFKSEQPQPVVTNQAHTAQIDVRGEIEDDKNSSADNIRTALKLAFTKKYVKGIILRINSPGGSPVQARQIYNDIIGFKKKYPDIKLYAVIEELGTSAAYLIASAADEIYADQTSLVGSIGVRLDSFGFVEAMKKVGVERRLYTAGKNKGALDPYLPRNPEEDAFIDGQLKLVHEAFIRNVREGRGNRLKETPDIFSGQFWCGEDALKLGLIDGFGDSYYVAKEIIKAEEIVDYTPTATLIDRLANKIGASIESALFHVRLN